MSWLHHLVWFVHRGGLTRETQSDVLLQFIARGWQLQSRWHHQDIVEKCWCCSLFVFLRLTGSACGSDLDLKQCWLDFSNPSYITRWSSANGFSVAFLHPMNNIQSRSICFIQCIKLHVETLPWQTTHVILVTAILVRKFGFGILDFGLRLVN